MAPLAVATFSRPAMPVTAACAISRAQSASRSAMRACSRKAVPIVVGTVPEGKRSKSFTLSDASSSAMRWDKEGWEMPSRAAARINPPRWPRRLHIEKGRGRRACVEYIVPIWMWRENGVSKFMIDGCSMNYIAKHGNI